jgi:hypothetical protein
VHIAQRKREASVEQAEGFGQSVDLFGPLKLSRTLFITYLDEDIMVARDESGVSCNYGFTFGLCQVYASV